MVHAAMDQTIVFTLKRKVAEPTDTNQSEKSPTVEDGRETE